MGWDNYTQHEISSSDTPTSCTKEQVGMKEYEVEGGNLTFFNVGDLALEENSEMFNLVNSFDF